MFFVLKKIISALILPPMSLILLGGIGILVSRKHPKTGKTLTIGSLLILLILSLPIIGKTLTQGLETFPPIAAWQLKDAQAIVILGADKHDHAPEFGGEGSVGPFGLERLRYGAHLQRQTGLPILVTGGAPFGGKPEAAIMEDNLRRDFHANNIWLETESKDTAQNAQRSAAILKQHGVERIALVSQAWHLNRAVGLFKQQGLVVYAAPTGFVSREDETSALWIPSATALNQSCTAIREYLGAVINKLGERQAH